MKGITHIFDKFLDYGYRIWKAVRNGLLFFKSSRSMFIVPSIIQKIVHKCTDRLAIAHYRLHPYVVTIDVFVYEGVRFEISSPAEVSRVKHFGGEENFTRLILQELSASDVLYDIGACVGMVTVHAAKKCAHVIAFEPDLSYRSRLVTNLRLNSLDNVQVVAWAVSNASGVVTLYTDGLKGNSPSLREVERRHAVQINTDSIDSALSRGEIISPDVVKMDIEGAEMLALQGMKQLLRSAKVPRTIFIEIHPDFLPAFGSSAEDVVVFLKSYGYCEDYRKKRGNQVHCIFRKRSCREVCFTE
jgi:FkbM family methyltransferase